MSLLNGKIIVTFLHDDGTDGFNVSFMHVDEVVSGDYVLARIFNGRAQPRPANAALDAMPEAPKLYRLSDVGKGMRDGLEVLQDVADARSYIAEGITERWADDLPVRDELLNRLHCDGQTLEDALQCHINANYR